MCRWQGQGPHCFTFLVLVAEHVKPATITRGLLRAPSAGGSNMLPAWAGFCDYVPAGVSVKTLHRSSTAQANASRAKLEQSR